jgi:hypothetical protein
MDGKLESHFKKYDESIPNSRADRDRNGIHLFWRFCLLFGDAVTGPTLDKRRHTTWGEPRGYRPYSLNQGISG